MAMTVFTEGRHAAEFILWEEEMNFSRDNVVVKAGSGIIRAGDPFGLISLVPAAGTVAPKVGGNTGNGTCVKDATTPVTAGAMLGTYTVTMTAATTFNVTRPDGYLLGTGIAGTAFNDTIKFMLTAGSTAFVAGDGFTFPVTAAAGGGKAVPNVAGASDGSQVTMGLIIYPIDATSVDVPVAALVRTAQVNGKILSNQLTGLQILDLAKVGIIVR